MKRVCSSGKNGALFENSFRDTDEWKAKSKSDAQSCSDCFDLEAFVRLVAATATSSSLVKMCTRSRFHKTRPTTMRERREASAAQSPWRQSTGVDGVVDKRPWQCANHSHAVAVHATRCSVTTRRHRGQKVTTDSHRPAWRHAPRQVCIAAMAS